MIVAGIDPSLTGLGIVSGPSDFDFEWRRVRALSFGYALPESCSTERKLMRVAEIADGVCGYVRTRRVERVWIEGQLSKGKAFNVPILCELIGVLRDQLYKQCGVVAELAPQTSVRKLLLGWVPFRDKKAAVIEALKLQGIVLDDADQYDALAVWNWGLHELSAPCLKDLLGEKPVKAKKSRARKGKTQLLPDCSMLGTVGL